MPSSQETVERLNTNINQHPLLPEAEKLRLNALLPSLTAEELTTLDTTLTEGTQEALGLMMQDAAKDAAEKGDTKTLKQFDEFLKTAGKTLRKTEEETTHDSEAAAAEELLHTAL